jgi:hypothetical protein
MGNFKISPLTQEKPAKKRKLSWLWLVIVFETAAAGYWIFRLHEKIHKLEQQVSLAQTKKEETADVLE